MLVRSDGNGVPIQVLRCTMFLSGSASSGIFPNARVCKLACTGQYPETFRASKHLDVAETGQNSNNLETIGSFTSVSFAGSSQILTAMALILMIVKRLNRYLRDPEQQCPRSSRGHSNAVLLWCLYHIFSSWECYNKSNGTVTMRRDDVLPWVSI